MTIIQVAALADNHAIGRNNELPWHLPDDFKFFKATTLGAPIVMGRKTFESLGKPLPGRTNVVISRGTALAGTPGIQLFDTIEGALGWLRHQAPPKAYIIGGGKIFEETIAIADELILTHVHTAIADADAFFPVIDHTQWKAVWHEEHPADERHAFAFTFKHYKRVAL